MSPHISMLDESLALCRTHTARCPTRTHAQGPHTSWGTRPAAPPPSCTEAPTPAGATALLHRAKLAGAPPNRAAMLIDPSDCRHTGRDTRAEKKPKLHASWPPGPQSNQRSAKCSERPTSIPWVVGGAKRYGNELNWTARQALYPNGALADDCFAQNPAQLEKHRTTFLIR